MTRLSARFQFDRFLSAKFRILPPPLDESGIRALVIAILACHACVFW
jgi:hypothetical protein